MMHFSISPLTTMCRSGWMFFYLLLPVLGCSQPFGNEWIQYNQTYYRIPVFREGFYRIPYSSLLSSIPNLSAVNPDLFALYRNGEQVPMYFSGGAGFSVGDYFEFYGYPNDGEADRGLYLTPSNQPHAYYSLFTDTATYYLTINPTGNNRRIISIANDLTNLPPKETSFRFVSRVIENNSVFNGRSYYFGSDPLYKPVFDEGEGFCGKTYFGSVADGSNQSTALSILVPTPYVTAGPVRLRSVYANNSPEIHQVQIRCNGSTVYSDNQSSFALKKVDIPLSVSNIGSTVTNVVYTAVDAAVSKRQNAHFLTEIEYSRLFNFENRSVFPFQVKANILSRKLVEVVNFNAGGVPPILYDLANGWRIQAPPGQTGSLFSFALPAAAADYNLVLRADQATVINTVNSLMPITFTSYGSLQNQGDFLLITHSSLRQPVNGVDPVEAYRKYRDIVESPLTGSFSARIADIEQIYHQFGYGVSKSPLAIQRFLQWASATWAPVNRPKQVLLIGKGHEYNDQQRTNPGFSASTNTSYQLNQSRNLIPTYGYPGSDNLYAVRDTTLQMSMGIGRIAASTPQQVAVYLDKVMAYENEQRSYVNPQSIAEKILLKNVLHFGGGTSNTEQQQFRSYLEQYASIARDTSWGANVASFYKSSSAPIDETLSQLIRNYIENGVSLITFFGHASANTFDVSIDEPENYNNAGKYPLVIANGCFSGDIHGYSSSFSDRFVLLPNKGSVAFLATSGLSVPSGLNLFTSLMYDHLNRSRYGQYFGESIRETFNQIMADPAISNAEENAALEFTLHGDPALKLNHYPKPDYAIEESSVSFSPTIISAGVDSFEMRIVITNLGKAIRDSLAVTIRRTLFNEQNIPVIFDYRKDIPAILYRDTVVFRLPTLSGQLGYGQNLFDIRTEADLRIDEMSEGNNDLLQKISVFIRNDDVIPVYPKDFAIVPGQDVVLKASTVNPFAPLRTYRFQLDTTELFNSPLLKLGQVTQAGGVLHWKPQLQMTDSTVYYWRVAQDTVNPSWKMSSFVYLPDEYPGWNQSHWEQYIKNDYLNVLKDSVSRLFRFPQIQNEIRVSTGIFNSQLPFDEMAWYLNSTKMHVYRMGGCGFNNGLTFAVIDSATGLPWASQNLVIDNFGDRFGNFHCSDKYYLQYGFDFKTSGTTPSNHPVMPSADWGNVIQRFLDSVPSGAFLLCYTINNPGYSGWSPAMFSTLSSIGFPYAAQLQNGSMNGPFVYFTQKGNPSYASVSLVRPTFTVVDTTFSFPGLLGSGEIRSTKIGPSQSWHSIHWRPVSRENPSNDQDSLYVYGITAANQEVLLISTQNNDLLNLETIIPAGQYPYIRLKQFSRDPVSQTPSQLYYWRVLYDQVPEGAVNPSAAFDVTNNAAVGESFRLRMAFENLTDLPMDSVLVKFTLVDASLTPHVVTLRYDTLGGNDTLLMQWDYLLNGIAFEGLNKVTAEVNPNNDQPEQYHFNNFADFTFQATGDKLNPLLDVTFDGRRIMHRDLVSARSDIVVSLRDENRFLALNDTSLLTLFLKYPGETQPRRIAYDNQLLTFYPADSGQLQQRNLARANFRPVLQEDGIYELLVKDKDRSQNNSSSGSGRVEGTVYYDYKIAFEVINKPMISNFLNWPNPFTTNTHFVFTITGSEVPDFLKIQIMNIRGTVVREIFRDELGPLHVGENLTEYAWDGTDQFGDPLANGVYFYRVIASMQGQRMDALAQDYDKYFKKGFGKMVLVR